MDIETLDAMKSLLEEFSNKDNATVTAAYLTVGGMLGVSIVGFIAQWFVTKRIVNEEHKRLHIQLHTESRTRQHEKWEADIQEGVMGLLKATDIEINPKIDPALVTSNVLKIQLLLNTNDPNQLAVNNSANELALMANNWMPNDEYSEFLRLHDQLLNAAKLLLYRPM